MWNALVFDGNLAKPHARCRVPYRVHATAYVLERARTEITVHRSVRRRAGSARPHALHSRMQTSENTHDTHTHTHTSLDDEDPAVAFTHRRWQATPRAPPHGPCPTRHAARPHAARSESPAAYPRRHGRAAVAAAAAAAAVTVAAAAARAPNAAAKMRAVSCNSSLPSDRGRLAVSLRRGDGWARERPRETMGVEQGAARPQDDARAGGARAADGAHMDGVPGNRRSSSRCVINQRLLLMVTGHHCRALARCHAVRRRRNRSRL